MMVNRLRSDATYPFILFNFFVGTGLLLIRIPYFQKQYDWSPPFIAWTWAIVFYVLSGVFLLVMPFIPPESGAGPYEHLPYWVSYASVDTYVTK